MKKITAIVLAAALAATLFTSCGKEEKDENILSQIRTDSEINYETVHATIGTLKEEVVLDGAFTAPYRTDLMFTRVGGTIASVDVHQDQEVLAGDVIATLSDEELEEQIVVQEIKLNSAKSTYETLQSQHASAEDVEFAKIAYELEQMTYDDLVETREYLVLRAPFDGRISSIRDYQPGSHIDANTTLCTIADTSRVCLTVSDYNRVLTNVSFGTKVDIDQGNLLSTTGKVVDTVTDDMTMRDPEGNRRTFSVTTYIIQCDENVEFLDLGGISVTFTTLRRDDAVIVPMEAIFEATDDSTNKTGNYVNVLLGGIKIQTPVTVGVVTGDGKAEIINGLDGSETLILR